MRLHYMSSQHLVFLSTGRAYQYMLKAGSYPYLNSIFLWISHEGENLLVYQFQENEKSMVATSHRDIYLDLHDLVKSLAKCKIERSELVSVCLVTLSPQSILFNIYGS